jgi:two-component system chemotaxis sensor kinase CheA
MIVLNNRPMPLLSLANVLAIPSDERGDMIHVVMLSTADRSVAFEVDYLFSEIELVLKPLGRELANAPYIAGGALLGSGEIIVVLDANDLVRRASGGGLRPAIVSHTSPNNKPIEQRRIRVLVVDDSITTRTLEKNILEAVGFEVYVATDGAEAWQRIPEVEPDVVVSDVEMPTMNGLELTRLIKSNEHTRDLPVILLTSLAKPEQREAGLRAGANAYLVKSRFDQQELLETVQSVL